MNNLIWGLCIEADYQRAVREEGYKYSRRNFFHTRALYSSYYLRFNHANVYGSKK